MSFQYSVQSGVGSDGKAWERTAYVQDKFHPEDEFRTAAEIEQDCKELLVDIRKLEVEIARK